MTSGKPCAHKWRAFTRHKVECAKCGKRVPWSNIIAVLSRCAKALDDLNPRSRFAMNPTFSAIDEGRAALNALDDSGYLSGRRT